MITREKHLRTSTGSTSFRDGDKGSQRVEECKGACVRSFSQPPTVNSCYATSRVAATGQTLVVVFNWTKRPSDALRKRREGDAGQRLANSFPDRHLPERPSLDGYTVREVPPNQVAQWFKPKRGTA